MAYEYYVENQKEYTQNQVNFAVNRIIGHKFKG